jgi:hypothetical protein
MAQITLSKTQRALFERAVSDRIAASEVESEIIDMIFAAHGTPKPTTQLSYNDGVIKWVENIEPVEG